jgi:hypothetical protein
VTNKQAKAKVASCPGCGTKTDGNFCPNCGVTLAGAKCPKCGTSVQAGAKFCHNCSAKLGAAGASPGSPVPWIAAAAVVAVLVIVVAVSLLPPATPSAPVAFPAPVVPQTPRAIADEDFNQSMMAHERGDIAGAASYGQRALDRYAALGGLDNDLRLHVGLIHIAMGNLDGTLAQADSLELAITGHLYASLLRQRVHEIRGNSSGVESAYSRFLEYYQREIDAGRPEYNEHTRMIDTFLAAASSAGRIP